MDFHRSYISPRSIELVNQALISGHISEGPVVEEFEKQLVKRLGFSFPVTTNSCTSALHMALILAGVKPGDEVITTAQTFVATAMAILHVSAVPVFADVEPYTGNLSPDSIWEHITDKTRAIIPVHYAGLPCAMDKINELAKGYGITVIEDAAHALGAWYHHEPVGAISRFTCFSFQAIKLLTSGDGGCLCCLHEEDAQQAERMRWFGIDRSNSKPSELGEREYNIAEVGYKYHMNDLSAAIGLGNLDELEGRLMVRQQIASIYRTNLANMPGLQLIAVPEGCIHAYWLFPVLVERRLDFVRALAGRGVPASVVHRRIDNNAVFGGRRMGLPGLDFFDEHQICIPVHDGLTIDEVTKVIEAIKEGW